jgi:hypothetical protein
MLGDLWKSLSDDRALAFHAMERLKEFDVTGVRSHHRSTDGSVEAALMTLDLDLFSVALWLRSDGDHLTLQSIYPFIRDGALVECEIDSILPSPDPVDGFIQAVGQGELFTFMDVLFGANRDGYREGSRMAVGLGGFMLHVRPFQQILDAMGSDRDKQHFLEQLDERGGVLISPSPSAQQAPESYLYIGPIGPVGTAEVMGAPVYRTSLGWSLGCPAPVALPVVFGANTLTPSDWTPQEGQWISAAVLLQGCEAQQI